jgi:hypothetical protein
MKYRVYYLDEPGTNDIVVEAPDDHAAAQQFFSQCPRNERCRIRVEAKSFAVAYMTPFVFLMAGIIFGCLFLAIADALTYLRHIRDSLAQKT